jgi:hypothetical protein
MTKLVFAGEPARDRYEVCIQSILLTDRTPQVAEWDIIVDLLKKLKKIGTALPLRQGVTIYELAPAPDGIHHTIDLEKAELKTLMDFIERPIWRVHFLEKVLDTKSWLAEARDAK